MTVAVAGKRILVFGDSLTHRGRNSAPSAVDVISADPMRNSSPGDLLASWFVKAGAAHVRINAKVGRSASNFFSSEPGAQILKDEVDRKPDLVFVFLGTNDIGLDQTKDGKRLMQIRAAFAEVGAEIWCIGPPSFPPSSKTRSGLNRNAGTIAVLNTERAVFGAAKVIDTRALTSDILTAKSGRAGDGIHFAPAGAKLFARRLAQKLGIDVGEPSKSKITPAVKTAIAITAMGAVVTGAVLLVRR